MLSSSTLLSYLKPYQDIDTLAKQMAMVYEQTLTRMDFVTQQFIPSLEKLDTCLHFLLQHKAYKDTPTYLNKAKQILLHALILIRNHYSTVMRRVTTDVQRILQDKVSSHFFLFLFYCFSRCYFSLIIKQKKREHWIYCRQHKRPSFMSNFEMKHRRCASY